MIDTHAHILPGIDDGAPTLEDSVALCRMAAEDGIQTLVCTPHINFRYENRRDTIEGPFHALQEAIEAEGIALQLVKGAEVHLSPDIVDKVKGKELVTYNDGGCYLLLEFPFQPVMTGDDEMVYRLRLAGVTPVIAHPERIAWFMEDPDRLHRLIRLGALGQVTGGSILGKFGDKSRRAAMTMLERNLVHMVATDAHDISYRRPLLAEAAEAIAQRFGEERSRAMTVETPRAVIEGAPIDPPEPMESPRSTRSFFGLFSKRP
jgi:protein-tyrosine phosphatase